MVHSDCEEAMQISMPPATSKELLVVNTCRVPKPSQAKASILTVLSTVGNGDMAHSSVDLGMHHALSVKRKDT